MPQQTVRKDLFAEHLRSQNPSFEYWDEELIKLANHLDGKGFVKEADYLDKIISKASLQSHSNEPSHYKVVENINPGCKHFKSKGNIYMPF